MQLSSACETMLDALENYDTAILPLGLYASDELVEGKHIKPRQMEWQGAIVPAIQSSGGREVQMWVRDKFFYQSTVWLPKLELVGVGVLRYSKIKVRKYGSRYHVDKHEDRSARWNRADLSGHISSLWKQSDFRSGDNRVLLLIAFDKSPEPLRRELDELHNNLNWETKNVVYHTRFWPDQAGRGFGVRLVAWARSMEDQIIL